MGYVARIPSSISELEANLTKIHENKGHISSITVNESVSHLQIDLDWSANKFGGEAGKDFYIPIKRGKLRDAKVLVDKLMANQHAPSRSEAVELYDLIDVQQR